VLFAPFDIYKKNCFKTKKSINISNLWNRKFVLGDATISTNELVRESSINFLWGLIGNSIVVFMAREIDFAVAVNFVMYYLLMSYIVNREKYKTRVGKFVIMPVFASMGAFIGYKFAQILSKLI